MYINTKKYKMDKIFFNIFLGQFNPKKHHFFYKMGQKGQKGTIYQKIVLSFFLQILIWKFLLFL